jgi:hypothetical protein
MWSTIWITPDSMASMTPWAGMRSKTISDTGQSSFPRDILALMDARQTKSLLSHSIMSILAMEEVTSNGL